ncbi:hypothetical protein Tco_0882837 [Tanacetum coccineum]
MINELSIVETNKVIHTVKSDMVKLVVEIKIVGMSSDEFETGSSDGLQPKQVDLSCFHALNEPHLHEIHVVSSRHKADQTDFSQKDEKPIKKRQNRTRDGKGCERRSEEKAKKNIT